MQESDPNHRDDLETMLAFLLEFAQLMLREQRGFHPFGAGLTPAGQMVSGTSDTLPPDAPARDVLEFVQSDLVQRATTGEIVVAGICTDVRVQPPGGQETDAISISLEDRNGEALEVFVPYRISDDGEVSYGEMFGTTGEQSIFVPVAG